MTEHMEFDELLAQMRFEYHAWLAAGCQDQFAPRILHLDGAPTFYDYLLMRGLSRFQLSAHGIGRDIQA